jgi:hypothetical protein
MPGRPVQLPDLARPKAVARAAQVVADREADVAAARATVEQAKIDVTAAVGADNEAYASALDAGRDDPGRVAEDAARTALADAERRLAVEEVRQQRARAALEEALAEALPAWVETARESVISAEAHALELVA